MTQHIWVNIYTGLYASCTDGAKYYVSPIGHATKKVAIEALDKGRAKSIRHRYIDTVRLNFKIKN
jgi:hypothetical protein